MAITTTDELRAVYPALCERLEKEARGETTVSAVTVVKDSKERMSAWTEETRDLDNKLISKRIDSYSYYPTGEIDEIVQEKYKGLVLILKQRIKHYKDGTQPSIHPVVKI